MEYNLKKIHTGKDLAISSMVLLAGVGLFFVNMGLGICIGICVLSMFVIYKGAYIMEGEAVLLTKKSEIRLDGVRAQRLISMF